MRNAADTILRPLWVAGLVATSTLGCDASPTPAPSFETQDSSGVAIASNAGQFAVGAGTIRVDEAPTLSIGTVAGDSVYQFSQIRGGARLPDGRLAIVDSNSRQVRLFDSRGAFLRAWGRQGDGPGEFQRPALAGNLADTLVLFDSRNRRLTWIAPDVGIVHEVRIDEEAGGFNQVQGLLEDGTVLAGGGFFFSSGSGDPMTTGVRRPPTGFVRLHRDGTVATDFGEFPGLKMYFEVEGPRVSARLVPFGPITTAAAGAGRVYVGTADGPEVQVFDVEGGLVGLTRWTAPEVRTTPDHVAAYVEESLADADDEDERRRIRLVARDHAQEALPPYDHLRVDALGHLWVKEYTAPGEDVSTYRVFTRDGELVARVALPPRVSPLEIGVDYVLARRLDEFDVEFVELYRLERQ